MATGIYLKAALVTELRKFNVTRGRVATRDSGGPQNANPVSGLRGEHLTASRDAHRCPLAGCIAPHLHVSFFPWGWQ
jgi:hypothetical protein